MHHLPPLPFEATALEPIISRETLSFHHGKHHQAYVTNLNALLENHPFKDLSLEELILKTYAQPEHIGLYNNAAQIWNHTFYWNCLKPAQVTQRPSDHLLSMIEKTFGSYENFCSEFKKAALTQFGSGWAWLCLTSKNELEILKTSNADCPMVFQKTALLTLDVWEHAYYVDYQNRRKDYIDAVMDHLIHWDFVNQQFQQAFSA